LRELIFHLDKLNLPQLLDSIKSIYHFLRSGYKEIELDGTVVCGRVFLSCNYVDVIVDTGSKMIIKCIHSVLLEVKENPSLVFCYLGNRFGNVHLIPFIQGLDV
jgi:hypothetical protein